MQPYLTGPILGSFVLFTYTLRLGLVNKRYIFLIRNIQRQSGSPYCVVVSALASKSRRPGLEFALGRIVLMTWTQTVDALNRNGLIKRHGCMSTAAEIKGGV